MTEKRSREELEERIRYLENKVLDQENSIEIVVDRALKESEERFHDIIDGATDISIQGYDQNRTVTFWNLASEKLYGYTRDEAMGKRLEDLIIPATMRDEVKQLHQQWVELGVKIPSGELVLEDKTGNGVPVFSSHVMHETRRGKEMFCLDIDLTPIKQSEEEKARLQVQLRQAQKMEALGTLAGGVAHDFNNILFSILGLSESLSEDLRPGSQEHENAEKLLLAARRGSELVKQILSFSRQSENKSHPVDFHLVMKEVIKLCRSTIPANIDIAPDLSEGSGHVMADPTELHQVAMNLIANAYQALDQDTGEIAIALKQTTIKPGSSTGYSVAPGRYALLTVTDSGVGIDPGMMDKIFDPYFTTKENGHGTGLGLATVYGIVKKYGGDIRVRSELGRGASFTVCLPVMDKPTGITPKVAIPAKQTGSERILLVDDEAAIAAFEKRMLTRLGYQITDRLSSCDALDAFRADPDGFDLVITDMAMPKMTGSQLALEILAVRRDIPIIICTGFSEQKTLEQAKAFGVKGFLTKPVGSAELAHMVRQLLDGETI